MRKIVPLLALVALTLAACGAPKPTPVTGPGAAVRLPADVVPESYELVLQPDAQHMSFRGSVQISLRALSPTKRLVLNAAELKFDRVSLDGRVIDKASLDAAAETAAFDLPRTLTRGAHVLRIDYHGIIRTASSGLFALDYDTPQGRRRALVTQMESADARRVLPCWDEPGRKATYRLSVIAPTGQMAVSNMPVGSVEPLAGGLQRVNFQPTPRMSSYLLFLALGDFERVSRKVDGVDIGVVVRKGAGAQAKTALDAAAELLAWYDRYFGIRYPLPKLDLIAAPGAGSFGAMENWGAIFFFEQVLLDDPRISTEENRRTIAGYIGHEMAHQWFGDLVTMAWWDDLWLNESFADWMEQKSLDSLHPDWRMRLRAAGGREDALRLDASSATHPIVEPAETMEQIAYVGDAITYDKGAAVIRMLEDYVGPEVWQAGVRDYLRIHAYGNATRVDLWRAVQAAAAGKEVDKVAHDFTEQDGVPLVHVEVMAGQKTGSAVLLTERRFVDDPASATGQRTWRVPVAARAAGGGPLSRTLLRAGPLIQALNNPKAGPLVINPDLVGYYRTLYSPSAFAPLAARFSTLDPADQLGLLVDCWALGAAGQEPVDDFLKLVALLPADAEPRVWMQTIDVLTDIDALYADPKARDAYRAWARARLKPVLARIGVSPKAGADPARGLRQQLLLALGRFGDPDAVAFAHARLDQALSANGGGLTSEARGAVLAIAGRHADGADFEKLRAAAAGSPDPLLKRQLLQALAGTEDPALAARVLDLAVGPETPPTLSPVVIRRVSLNHPALAFQFAQAHWSVLRTRLDTSQQTSFVPSLFQTAADAALADQLRAYSQATYGAGGRRDADQAEAAVRVRALVRAGRLPQINAWISRQG